MLYAIVNNHSGEFFTHVGSTMSQVYFSQDTGCFFTTYEAAANTCQTLRELGAGSVKVVDLSIYLANRK